MLLRAEIKGVEVIHRGDFDTLAPKLAQASRSLIESGEGRFEVSGGSDFDGISLIIPIRDEDEFISKTISFTLGLANKNLLKEIIVIDDCSKREASSLLNEQLPSAYLKYIKVIRLDKCEGLIRSRILGADASKSSVIVFMDGHCRPKENWIQPLIDRLREKPKAIVCPMIEDIDRYTWKDLGTFGLKMMFDWNFEFNWYEDFTDIIPIASGGLYAITREWWEESGKYDPGMLEWGGENIEQSIRIWRCGGEIVAEKRSRVGHIFKRDPKPNPENKLVLQVQRNQKRAAMVWLDKKRYKYFETIHDVVKTLNETESGVDLEQRHQIKERLNCKPFSWYVDKFRASFDRGGLLLDNFRHLKHRKSGLCLAASLNEVVTGTEDKAVIFRECNPRDDTQKWSVILGRRLILNRRIGLGCLTRGPSNVVENSILRVVPCEFKKALEGYNDSQYWNIDASDELLFDQGYEDLSPKEYSKLRNSLRLFNRISSIPFSNDGNDRISVNGEHAFNPSNRCITNLNDKAVMKSCPQEDKDEDYMFDPIKMGKFM
ncbi:extracellular with a signal peptide followed by a family 2 glycosyltransferase and ricin domains [Cryptosporidium sp. chipmunk genotype I]|uniref:extracellular with a signal peptide followed by a family 2 glycosyltransferase and ricin domains n=1 Tax=Cryptosporidium sp. chipmunk genotype I TaxID=1280935 RepID=UPI00351AAEF9|nr:extracellular with a signal peptide followed by a family 2 glycosyltransferase and ricin domains [Cryptosporidium sp. chipmunk genotype I]